MTQNNCKRNEIARSIEILITGQSTECDIWISSGSESGKLISILSISCIQIARFQICKFTKNCLEMLLTLPLRNGEPFKFRIIDSLIILWSVQFSSEQCVNCLQVVLYFKFQVSSLFMVSAANICFHIFSIGRTNCQTKF